MLFTILALLALLVAVIALVGAAVTMGVAVQLYRRGDAAAREAYERGDSLSNWWYARQPANRATPGLGERRSLAGRVVPQLGVVAVEERAPYSSYTR